MSMLLRKLLETTPAVCRCRLQPHNVSNGLLATTFGTDRMATRWRSSQMADTAATTNHAAVEFTRFYRFPHIRWVRGIARLKIYQTAATMLMLPPMCYTYTVGAVSLPSVQAAFAVATFAGVMLYGVSGYTRNFIGMLSLNKAGDMVRISHLTFWGKRRDIYAPVQDIVPLADLSENPKDIYVKLCRYSTNDVLYFSLRAGGIEDMAKFVKVFGSLDVS